MSSSGARNAMRMRFLAIVAVSVLVGTGLASLGAAKAQDVPRRVALKSGESVDLGTVYYVNNCRLIMIGLPDIEVLEGPTNVALSIREEPVLPRRQGCAAKVAGGTLVLTAKDVTEPVEAKLTYRLNYKTKDGPRQTSGAYMVSLFPDH
jgi:hypothetical protein